MFPALPLAVGAVGLGLILMQLSKKLGSRLSLTGTRSALMSHVDNVQWVRINIDGQDYEVSPTYLAPMGIGEAVQYAKDNGLVLPTPRMVNAIWQAADLKVAPISSGAWGEENKGDNAAQFAKHAQAIEQQLAGRPFTLLGGTHKDVVFIDKVPWQSAAINKPGIYGWHRPDGSRIQQEMWGHALSWKDYSQGLRLIRKV